MKWKLFVSIFLVFIPLLAQAQQTATITWAPNTEADLAGYNVYRLLGACGTQGPMQKIQTVGKVTQYVDKTIEPTALGATYALTAFDTTGNESQKSITSCRAIIPKLPAPQFLQPTHASSVPEGLVTFSWTLVPGAAGYQLCVHLAGTTYDGVCQSLAALSATKLLTPGSHDWWVLAVDSAGKQGQSQGAILVVTPAPVAKKQCEDGKDNDGDGKIDMADLGCTSPTDDDETNTIVLKACENGKDDDGDGMIDLADLGCDNPTDDDETDPIIEPEKAACENGKDDDQDGKIDMADPGCTDPKDDDETDPIDTTPPKPPTGVEVVSRTADEVTIVWNPEGLNETFEAQRLNQETGQWKVLKTPVTSPASLALPTSGRRIFRICSRKEGAIACGHDGVWASR